jgi:hypothetical protein
VVEAVQTSGATYLVKTLQMIRLQKAIIAVGMFSIFEPIVQDGLDCRDGFMKARKYLECEGEDGLKKRFSLFVYAINVLKHGRGPSYDALLAESDDLPFRIKRPDEIFFFEGDVSEVSTLIEVDDQCVGSHPGGFECDRQSPSRRAIGSADAYAGQRVGIWKSMDVLGISQGVRSYDTMKNARA